MARRGTLFRAQVFVAYNNTGLFEIIVEVLTTCHTQYTWDRSICIFLFNRTTLQVFVTYLIGALYVHPLWFYKHQHQNRVRSELFVVKTPTIISNNPVHILVKNARNDISKRSDVSVPFSTFRNAGINPLKVEQDRAGDLNRKIK